MSARWSGTLTAILTAHLLVCPIARGADPEPVSGTETPDALVQNALRAELEGDLVRRQELLFSALDRDSNYAPTNWHLGYMRSETGNWLSIPQHQQLNTIDATRAEYRAFREKVAGERDADWRLGEWCTRNHIEDIAAVHYARVLGNNGYEQSIQRQAMRRLGLQLYQGALLTEDEIKAAKEQAKSLERAFSRWVPRLREWQERVNAATKSSEQAAAELQNAQDPQLVHVLEAFLPQSGELFGQALVAKLGATQTSDATEVLVKFAVLSPWPQVRQAAIDELKLRSMFDYVPLLLSGLVSPIQTGWTITEADDGGFTYQHLYYQEGVTEDSVFETAVRYRPRAGNFVQSAAGARLGRFIDVLRSVQEAEARERAIVQANLVASDNNQRVFEVLEETTRAQVIRDPRQWREWWQDYNDVEVQKQTRYGSQQQQRLLTSIGGQSPTSRGVQAECFVPGTKVWTETGVQPIETIQIGDRVLSQLPETGELCFKPVIATTMRKPVPVVQMYFESERITSTLGHPLWVTGDGWRMAKHLQPDQQLHSLYGGVNLKKIARLEEPSTVINLVVADFHTYFVGETAVLVHDNVYREPSRAVVPGLMPEE